MLTCGLSLADGGALLHGAGEYVRRSSSFKCIRDSCSRRGRRRTELLASAGALAAVWGKKKVATARVRTSWLYGACTARDSWIDLSYPVSFALRCCSKVWGASSSEHGNECGLARSWCGRSERCCFWLWGSTSHHPDYCRYDRFSVCFRHVIQQVIHHTN
jgi:hypothetical protein